MNARVRLEESLKHLFPYTTGASDKKLRASSSYSGLKKGVLQAVFEGAMLLVPHISDEQYLSVFDSNLRQLAEPDQTEFVREILLMGKRRVSSPLYREASVKLLRRVVQQQAALRDARQAFREKNGFGPPNFFVISPTMRCNLRCTGCYAGEYTKADDLPLEVIRKVIKEARDLGIVFITVSGGEPFFSEEVQQMWEENPDISFMVYTNGTLIDHAMAKRIKKLGNVYPCISVEGFETETDNRRGKGTFAKIMNAMDNLKSEGLLFGFSATVIQSNNELVSSPEFIDFYVNKGCFLGWYFNYMPIGRAPDLSLMPTPEQRLARWRRLKELRKTRPILLADFWCDGTLVHGCIAGGRCYFHINNKGEAEPCVFTHFAADNVKEKSLVDIIKSPLFTNIRARQPYSENLLRPCMIIDNPDVLRELVKQNGAKPTHDGADTIIKDLSPNIDEYARKYAEATDPVWANEHAHALKAHIEAMKKGK